VLECIDSGIISIATKEEFLKEYRIMEKESPTTGLRV
jgi:hypothetical protein